MTTYIYPHIGGRQLGVDLDQLSPRARALAEAINDHPAQVAGDIWVESDAPIRETTPDWEDWFTPEEAAQPERRPWRGWNNTPLAAGAAGDVHARLEEEAAKIPPGWHVIGAHPHRPVPSAALAAATREVTTEQVIKYLADRGRTIASKTWTGYVARGQAPAPVRRVARTPIWNLDDIDAWLDRGAAT